MTHSVERHLSTTPDQYDAEIRRFIPGYEAMLQEVVGALSDHLPPNATVLDLGAGTGALSQRIAEVFPSAKLILVDVDAAMLANAEQRLAPHRSRIELLERSFAEPLPRCDAAVASLALHHLKTPEAKTAAYANILRSLNPGGLLAIGDATIPSPVLAEPIYRRWAAHLVAHGDSEQQAWARFPQWAEEDRYFRTEEELDMLRSAGFADIDVRWRLGPLTVLVARRE